MTARVLVCCGVGGTGKTTTAAALGVAHAAAGYRTVVLTIDPARRLADALGIELNNRPTPVPGAQGLSALMLDRQATWTDVIRRFSTDEAQAERLLSNRYFRSVATRLTGSHEYMAVEKLYELVHGGEFDLVVLDTPPAQHVLDFFRAPERVRSLFDGGGIQALLRPRSVVGFAAQGVVRVVEQIAGAGVMADVREFFDLIAQLSESFRAHSDAVAELLVSQATQYLLVTDASAPERSDVLGFLGELRERRMQFAGFLVNRTAPRVRVREIPDQLQAPGGFNGTWPSWERALLAIPEAASVRNQQHARAAERLAQAAGGAPVWRIPEVPGGITDLHGLEQLVPHLPPRPPA